MPTPSEEFNKLVQACINAESFTPEDAVTVLAVLLETVNAVPSNIRSIAVMDCLIEVLCAFDEAKLPLTPWRVGFQMLEKALVGKDVSNER